MSSRDHTAAAAVAWLPVAVTTQSLRHGSDLAPLFRSDVREGNSTPPLLKSVCHSSWIQLSSYVLTASISG
ncbi:hypothetical protein M5K25_003043 [Dendrobium thyrsiflorum]|uniref:Secreted protein n=1 Tax=Dendrobium thyrsiflorum TaxID=117978 RepID=A0ABD0VQ82_DENTH